MDVFVKILSDFGFERLSSSLHVPIVVHCVPGAGKSSCIRALLKADSRFAAYTLGVSDPCNLDGLCIKAFTGSVDLKCFNILDEYTRYNGDTSNFFALFGDPVQSPPRNLYRAHYKAVISKRFGRCTAQLLRELGFEVESTKEDLVSIRGLYDFDPVGTVLYYEKEIGCLLRAHSVEAYEPEEVVGRTFETVTFVTAGNHIPAESRHLVYQCLTRHRSVLHLMTPDASYTST
uniref:Triple gene block 1 protein n=1 Tax=Chrysanthemum virus B TaxID=12165 RepID=Q5ZF07_CVB|nr:triple gene block 1 protein [Chrysanthemum virus B]CAO78689.1 triple gene block protein 1 [Chrysanthemum virus B]